MKQTSKQMAFCFQIYRNAVLCIEQLILLLNLFSKNWIWVYQILKNSACLTLLRPIEFFIMFDTVKSEWSIVYIVKPVLSRHSRRRPKIGFQDGLSLNAGQSTAECSLRVFCNTFTLHKFIKLPFVFKTFVLSIFEWPLKTGFTVLRG